MYSSGYEKINMIFKERNVIIILADKKIRTTKWALKTEYFNAFTDVQDKLLENGINLVFVENETRWCKDIDIEIKRDFVSYLHNEFGFDDRCIIIGMSAGGLIGIKFAAIYPECVSVLYLDAPVLNLLSCPLSLGCAQKNDDMIAEFCSVMNTNASELLSYREHPIDKIHRLLENKLPIVLVCGLDDVVVPYCENGKLLYDYYKANGGEIKQILKENCGHHPHGLEDPSEIVGFILKYA